MGLTLVLTDSDLPASPAFIEFLYETLNRGTGDAGDREPQSDILKKAHFVVNDPRGNEYLLRSYRFFKELLTGNVNTLRDISRFRFFFVVGLPGTGGTYIVNQLFRACGIEYAGLQDALVHDGFPHLGYLSFKEQGNIHTNGLLQFAEYLTMVEIFFGKHGALAYRGGIIVPKKFSGAVYYFDLIRELIGANAQYIITLRHPLSTCKSLWDKSGMPPGGKFVVRNAIEASILNDWMHWGISETVVRQMHYMECFLGYWKRFHFQMAMAGIPNMPFVRIVSYGAQSMTGTARDLNRIFGVHTEPEPFKSAERASFSKYDETAARKAMEEVASFWKGLGVRFPLEDLAAGL